MTEQSASKSETVVERIVGVPVGVGKTLEIGIETAGRDVENGAVEGGTGVVEASKIFVGDLAAAGRQLGRDVRVVVSRASDSLKPPSAPAPAASPATTRVLSAPVAAPAPVAVGLKPVVVTPAT
jgi:hypothetical protein